jgi:hypothetical protein
MRSIRELRSRTLIPLSQLTVVDHSSPMYNEGSRRGLLYAQSWALMHYFRFGSEPRRVQLSRYPRLLERESGALDSPPTAGLGTGEQLVLGAFRAIQCR